MASTCSSVVGRASSSSLVVTKKYDVFISFRGEDTRGDFTSHLHAALCKNSNMETYIDYRIQKGYGVWAELLKAIKDSSIFLVIFSENYASSSWCLNELVELMECKKQGGDVHVIPVFYKIDPSQVRKQSGSYHTAFATHKKDRTVSKEKLQNWKDALYDAANLSGFHSKAYRTESDLIEDIVSDVLQKINHKYPNDFRGSFISDENYTNIESLLRIDSEEVRVIGIWGMGGIGKTTLAAAIFYKVSSQYEITCFLENVVEESKRHGLNYVCNKLLSKLLREDLHIDTPKVIPSYVGRRLRCKKVLIVLDDVNTLELLENLVGVVLECLGAGSRVIVTTRDKHVLTRELVNKIHEVKKMNSQKSLELFSLNAFGKTYPEKGYEELSKRALFYANGIPLALKVLGSFLYSRSENEWDSALRKLKKTPNVNIQAVLRLSYEGLDVDERNIFLDIACFLKGRRRGRVTKLLNDCGFSADIGIRRLVDKALITFTPYFECIDMHDLIQEMGREVVREESTKNPGLRSRLWDPEEICDVLTNNKGTDAIEGIQLDITQITYINLSAKAFRNMPNLRLLTFRSRDLERNNSRYLPIPNGDFERINSVYLPNGLEFLPKNLKLLWWQGYPLESLPSRFFPEALVVLSMEYSNMKKLWNGVQELPNLEKINLHGSKRLKECPNLSRAPNIKYVILSYCESLSYIDASIFSLPKLELLNVKGCKSLKSLGNNGTLSQSLRVLLLDDSGLSELPPSISHIRNLVSFSFSINDCLADLPENFANRIVLSEARKHKCDAFSILQKSMPSSGFRSLKLLIFYNCQSLYIIPDNISLLSSLKYLRFCYSAIIALPESIKDLPRLKFLAISDCKMLQHIPTLPQSIQYFEANCQSLQTVLSTAIESSKRTSSIFLLADCINLDELSYDAILKDAIAMIEHGTEPLTALVSENEEDASLENDKTNEILSIFTRNGNIFYSLPARSGKVRDWFHCHFTQDSVTIELPPNLLGFIFYSVVSQVQSCDIGRYETIGCKCHLQTGHNERLNITSFFIDEQFCLATPKSPCEFMADHVFIWYDAQCCKQIMEVIKERKAINEMNTTDLKVTFKFFIQNEENNEVVVIKECGFRWIYSLEGGCKFKRSQSCPNKVKVD